MENKELIKPFTMKLEEEQKELIKPFKVDESLVTEKLYLLLLVFSHDEYEDERTFEFIEGTSAEVYNYIKMLLEDDNDLKLDLKKSTILVDSPRVTISKRINLYKFMKNVIVTGKVIDDSGFNIDDFYYGDEDDEEEEY